MASLLLLSPTGTAVFGENLQTLMLNTQYFRYDLTGRRVR